MYVSIKKIHLIVDVLLHYLVKLENKKSYQFQQSRFGLHHFITNCVNSFIYYTSFSRYYTNVVYVLYFCLNSSRRILLNKYGFRKLLLEFQKRTGKGTISFVKFDKFVFDCMRERLMVVLNILILPGWVLTRVR